MITEAHVEKLLRHWADEHLRVLLRAPAAKEGPAPPTNPLADQVVHRTRERGARKVLTAAARAAVARRLIAEGMRRPEDPEAPCLPSWAGGDPIRGKESRSRVVARWEMDAIGEAVERWIVALWHWDPRAALALHAHYRYQMGTGRGTKWLRRASQLRVTEVGYIAAIARGRLAIRRAAESELKKAS